MLRKIPPLLSAFFFLSALHLLSLLLGLEVFRWISKPLLISTLAVYFWRATREYDSSLRRLFLAGLVFSVLGDTSLLFSGESFFLLGLGCFLVTQACYLIAFLRYRPEQEGYLRRHPWSALPLLFYLILLMAYLWPDLPVAFRAPVLVYGLVITGMALGSLHAGGRLPRPLFRRLLTGALLFLLSDSLIALTRFKDGDADSPLAALLIMSTYLAAQYLIGTSAVSMTKAAAAGPLPAESS